jgi:hypothetical protein
VAITFLLTKPTIIAIIVANIFGLFSMTRSPEVFKKIAGKIIAGNIADGTKDKTSLILSVNISFLIIAIIRNLEKKVINPQ